MLCPGLHIWDPICTFIMERGEEDKRPCREKCALMLEAKRGRTASAFLAHPPGWKFKITFTKG